MSTDTTNTPTETVAEDPALAEAVRLADGFLAGISKVSTATVDQLERRLRYAESWLRRLRHQGG